MNVNEARAVGAMNFCVLAAIALLPALTTGVCDCCNEGCTALSLIHI